MQRVFSSPSLWEAREILTLLEQNRVDARLLNEHVAGMPGLLPLNAMMTADAEVWVLDVALAAQARRLIDEFQAAAARIVPGASEAGAWCCSRCGEENPAAFEICWSCGNTGQAGGTSTTGSPTRI